jgi:hypothetical protein
MPRIRKIAALCPVGTVTSGAFPSIEVPTDANALSLELEITAVGATPTMTWLFQASMDEPSVSDAASDWDELSVIPTDAPGETVNQTKTGVGVYGSDVNLRTRPIRKLRLLVTANTNCTYEGDAYSVVDTY